MFRAFPYGTTCSGNRSGICAELAPERVPADSQDPRRIAGGAIRCGELRLQRLDGVRAAATGVELANGEDGMLDDVAIGLVDQLGRARDELVRPIVEGEVGCQPAATEPGEQVVRCVQDGPRRAAGQVEDDLDVYVSLLPTPERATAGWREYLAEQAARMWIADYIRAFENGTQRYIRGILLESGEAIARWVGWVHSIPGMCSSSI